MKHKHAELIKAWADGAEIEWQSPLGNWISICNPNWDEYTRYRIKPEVPQWRKDMAQALKDGKEVQFYVNGKWIEAETTAEQFLTPNLTRNEEDYRIKPEPKPDVVRYGTAEFAEFFNDYGVSHIFRDKYEYHNLKLIWDGESGALKGAEVLS